MKTIRKNKEFSILKFIDYKHISLWDVKRFVAQVIKSNYSIVELGLYIKEQNIKVKPFEFPDEDFKILGVNNKTGIFDAYIQKGAEIKQPYKKVEVGFLAYNPYRINVGSIGIRTEQHNNEYISPAYVVFSCKKQLNPDFLFKVFSTDYFNTVIRNSTTGSVRQNLTFSILQTLKIPLPDIKIQNQLLHNYYDKIQLAENQEAQADELEKNIDEYLFKELGTYFPEKKEKSTFLDYISFKDIIEWGIDKIKGEYVLKSTKFEIVSFAENTNLYYEIFRGKSPKYKQNSTEIILNQKCNRWNKIELEHAKTVNEIWYNSIPGKSFTKKNDIIINSTGDGTIGRATKITSEYENLIYDSHILLLRLNPELVKPLFFTYFFNSKFGQIQIEKIKSAQSTKQTELGVENLKKIQFPLPKPEKQQEISEQIQSWETEIKNLREQAKTNREKAIKEFENQIFEK